VTEQYDNEKRGVLFRNKDKVKDTQPDFKGNVTVEGVEYWLSAWVQESKKGVKYFSLSLQNKQEVHDRGVEQAKQAAGPGDFTDDSIPF
jgi:hypothetical protein